MIMYQVHPITIPADTSERSTLAAHLKSGHGSDVPPGIPYGALRRRHSQCHAELGSHTAHTPTQRTQRSWPDGIYTATITYADGTYVPYSGDLLAITAWWLDAVSHATTTPISTFSLEAS